MLTFDESNKTLILAMVSHPVYKFKWITDERNASIAKSFLEEEIQNQYDPIEIPQEQVNETEEVEDDEFLPRGLLSSTRRISVQSETITGAGIELLNFLEDRDKNLSMLKKYPRIDAVFRKFNSTLSSSAPVERLFSQALLIFTCRRNRISHRHFEMALLLKMNKELWFKYV